MPIYRAFAPYLEGDKGDRRVTGITLTLLSHSAAWADSSAPLSSLATVIMFPVIIKPVCT